MDKILNQLIDGVTSGNVLVVVLIVFVAIIFNLEKIFSFRDARKKVKIQLIEESLDNPNVRGSTKRFLENLIETEYFKSITGIYLEKEVREALIQAHQRADGELRFFHYRRAIPYLRYKNGILGVKINVFEMVGFVYNFVFGMLGVIAGVVLLILPAVTPDVSIANMVSIYGLALFCECVGWIMLIQSSPVFSARFVQRQLKKNIAGGNNN